MLSPIVYEEYITGCSLVKQLKEQDEAIKKHCQRYSQPIPDCSGCDFKMYKKSKTLKEKLGEYLKINGHETDFEYQANEIIKIIKER